VVAELVVVDEEFDPLFLLTSHYWILWGTPKGNVYQVPSATAQNMRQRITEKCAAMIPNVTERSGSYSSNDWNSALPSLITSPNPLCKSSYCLKIPTSHSFGLIFKICQSMPTVKLSQAKWYVEGQIWICPQQVTISVKKSGCHLTSASVLIPHKNDINKLHMPSWPPPNRETSNETFLFGARKRFLGIKINGTICIKNT
jgi:hypothetical protein